MEKVFLRALCRQAGIELQVKLLRGIALDFAGRQSVSIAWIFALAAAVTRWKFPFVAPIDVWNQSLHTLEISRWSAPEELSGGCLFLETQNGGCSEKKNLACAAFFQICSGRSSRSEFIFIFSSLSTSWLFPSNLLQNSLPKRAKANNAQKGKGEHPPGLSFTLPGSG